MTDAPPSLTTLASAVKPMPPFDFSVIALAPAKDDATFEDTFWVRLNEMPMFSFPA
jgi:hypothetical protein